MTMRRPGDTPATSCGPKPRPRPLVWTPTSGSAASSYFDDWLSDCLLTGHIEKVGTDPEWSDDSPAHWPTRLLG